ncbi:hypothetical protein [Fischerella thermalis]|uniref:hypothetical protein n=1 Tax=Fischerella thermalis TaxID=372787 RepID=UPI00307CEBED
MRDWGVGRWGTRGPHDRQGVGIRGNGEMGSVRSVGITTNHCTDALFEASLQQPTTNNQLSTIN